MKEIVDFIQSVYPGQSYIPLHAPVFRGNEQKYVLDTIETTIVSSVGAYVEKFEQMVCDYTGAKYAVATVNGTSALHMCLLLTGVQSDDLVITQALSFVATSNAIKYTGADPLYIDIDLDTLGMSPSALEKYLSESTKADQKTGQRVDLKSGKRIAACVPMHTFGFPAAIDQLSEICKEYQIPLIEDSAESLGSAFKNRHTGTFGLMGVFSFNGNKTITSGGGGMIITNDETLAKRAKHLTTQAKIPHSWEYYHDQLGYNYRCPNINAALACAQMEQLESFVLNKRETAELYMKFFKNRKDAEFLEEPKGSRANYWLNSILFPSKKERDDFLKYSNERLVMARPVWQLLNRLPMYMNCRCEDLSNSIDVEGRLVNIPSSVR